MTVCDQDYIIICITKTWLNDSVCNHVSPSVYSVSHADRDYSDYTISCSDDSLLPFINLLPGSNTESVSKL
jgi:hypothetical protein